MLRFCLAALAAMVLVAAASTPVLAQSPAPVVLYSYAKVTVGNDVQYVLLPTASKFKTVPGAALSPAVVNAVFNELKTRKGATYGGTSLEVSTGSLAKGTAVVTIDSTKQKYATIIRSETVYTLTQLGLSNVKFKGDKKAVDREGVDRAAFSLTVPAWRALPPARIAPAVIHLPDGSSMSSRDFYNKIASKDPMIEKLVRGYLASKDSNVVMSVIASVPKLGLTAEVELLLPLLKNKDSKLRGAGLSALAGNEKTEVLDAISDVMDKDKDRAIAQRAASILGKSKNRLYSVRALYFNLRGSDEKAALEAVAGLASSKEPTAAPELVKAARGKNQKVALASIEALAALNQHAQLVQLFLDGKVDGERRQLAAKMTTGLKDSDARFKALTFQAKSGTKDVAIGAIEALASTKSPDPRVSIEGALGHPETEVRHLAINKIAAIGNPASLKALAAAGTKAEDLELVEDVASVIMGKLVLSDVLQYTSSKNIVLQRVAYRALGAKSGGAGGGRVFDVLKKGTASKDGGIRASSALALGAFKNDKALKLVAGLGKDKEGKVRRNVARALANWPSGTHTPLLYEYLKDGEGEVVAAAVDTFTARKEYEAYKPVLKLYRGKPHPFAGARMAVLRSIVVLAPEKELQTVISVVGGGLFDKERDVKLLAIELLGNYDNPAAVTTLAALINDPVEEFRVKSLLALGRTKSKDSIELIMSVMNDQSPTVRAASMEACGLSGQKSCVDPMRTQLALEKDPAVLAAGKAGLKKLK
jgi:HEAT repeat protein